MAKPSSASPLPESIASLSFEQAMMELEKLVKQLEDGKASLQDAIGAYERGSLLRQHCERQLRQAQLKIEQITQQADGSVTTKDFTA